MQQLLGSNIAPCAMYQLIRVSGLVLLLIMTLSRSDIGSGHTQGDIMYSFISAPSTLTISRRLQCLLPFYFSPTHLWNFWACILVNLELYTQCLAYSWYSVSTGWTHEWIQERKEIKVDTPPGFSATSPILARVRSRLMQKWLKTWILS